MYYPGESETKEFYISILLDRKSCKNIIMYSEGGMDVEELQTPELIFKETVNPTIGLQKFQARQIAFNSGLKGEAQRYDKIYLFVVQSICQVRFVTLAINPLLKTADDKTIVVDSKVTIDSNALFRHPDYSDLRDLTEKALSRLK